MADGEADLALRQFDADFALIVVDQPQHFADGLARHDHAGHAVRALGQGQVDLRQAMAIGRDRAQGGCLGGAGRVQIDAVEVVAGLLGRDRKLGAVDQPLQIGGGQRERMRHVAGGEIRKIVFGQGLQREAGAAGTDRQHRAITVAFQHDLRAVRQLAHDVVEHVRRHGGGAPGRGFRRQRLRHLEVEVGGFQRQPGALGADQHVAQDRNGVAALDHAMDVAQRLQELRALDGDLHSNTRLIPKMEKPGGPKGAPRRLKPEKPDRSWI